MGNIITHTNMKYTFQSQLTKIFDYDNGFLDKCYSELPKDLRKLAINSTIGELKPNIEKHLLKSYIKYFEVEDKDITLLRGLNDISYQKNYNSKVF